MNKLLLSRTVDLAVRPVFVDLVGDEVLVEGVRVLEDDLIAVLARHVTEVSVIAGFLSRDALDRVRTQQLPHQIQSLRREVFGPCQLFFKVAAVAVLQVEVFLVAAHEQIVAGVQKIEDAAHAEHITRLVVDDSVFAVLQNLRRHEAQRATAVVLYLFAAQLLLANCQSQVRKVQR